ncbi:MAG: polyhydroxyalkanoate synthesis repressor PhaR [Pseudomonadales bacterium]|jgi:polyhydroxyalkanoate synthesis repressor PhaR|nr:polyhydroxyalkanoate synthesis repressor PhaR [Pseudomonadales bacterium]MDP6470123.1 polyhydroxyalkanoate synthesis repressor PhaR [Pseudomonadales bacterium]MDP6827028.1 polyhydroxyalkanoate synthesis repressor PhaR [Pseudomonadales bacterium]MDP6972084.1 polyhydroxyalkanoate synthesis repressor PhaR [Pseudomonadales bacterium]|tara:strand:+ start:4693 stop:5145 length:453 start_codon:yes stop_codon:yes gene_type:complete
MHHLKKYPNRRLYDTSDSKYVTINDVRKLIIAGESVQVHDARSDENITRTVLLQILAEQEAEGHEPVLTNRAIEQIIRFYGDRMGGVVSRYIEQSILTYLDHQDQFRQRMRQLNELNPLNLMRDAFENPWTPRDNASPDGDESDDPRGKP